MPSANETGIVLGYVLLGAALLSFYFQFDDFRANVDYLNEYLESATVVVPFVPYLPPISILDFFGSACVCRTYRRNVEGRKSWFEVLVACTLMQFGGTTITGFLLGQTPSWIMSKSAFPAMALAWWLTFYCPGDVFWKAIKNNSILLFVLGMFGAVSSAHAVSSWGVDKALFNAFHVNKEGISKAYMVCTLSGAFSASGGGILTDVLGFFRPNKSFVPFRTPSLFMIDFYEASATINKALLLAVVYYSLVNPHYPLPFGLDHVDKVTGHSILSILNLSIFFQSTHLPHVNVCQQVSSTLLGALNIQPVVNLHKAEHVKSE